MIHPPCGCFEHTARWRIGSDRRGETPITSLTFGAAFKRLAPRARLSIMARSPRAPHPRPEIRLQSELQRQTRSE
jgi:hypothetical protein